MHNNNYFLFFNSFISPKIVVEKLFTYLEIKFVWTVRHNTLIRSYKHANIWKKMNKVIFSLFERVWKVQVCQSTLSFSKILIDIRYQANVRKNWRFTVFFFLVQLPRGINCTDCIVFSKVLLLPNTFSIDLKNAIKRTLVWTYNLFQLVWGKHYYVRSGCVIHSWHFMVFNFRTHAVGEFNAEVCICKWTAKGKQDWDVYCRI